MEESNFGRVVWWLLLSFILAIGPVHAQNSIVCGGQLSQQSGVITSPGYPDNYPNSKRCEWTITAADKEIIDLRFSRLDLEGIASDVQWIDETCPDYVRVYDGSSASSPLIVAMCRINTQEELAKMIIRSTKNKMYILFNSDYQGQRPGFVASYWIHECPKFTYGDENCNNTCKCKVENTVSCNNTNNECLCKKGWTSPDCSQDVNECLNPKIEPCPQNYTNCVNNIGSFECECYPGLSQNRNGDCEVEPASACSPGNGCSHLCVRISGQEQCYCPDNMKLVGKTCQACSSATFGQDCRLSCPCQAANTDSCNTATGGCICSKGWTLDDCSRDINECTELPVDVCPNSNELCVNTLGGYECVFCSFNLTEPSGVIQSPKYPDYTTRDVTCNWTISTTDSAATIAISMSDIYISHYGDRYRDPCTNGFLEIYDGMKSSAQLLARYCGSYNNPIGIVRSSGNAIHIGFRTTISGSHRFTGNYSTSVYQVRRFTITDPSGVISSPGYPVSPSNNVYYTWTITVIPSNVVKFSLSDFGLGECGKDFIDIYDGKHAGTERIGRICGAANLTTVSSTNRTMLIVFSSLGSTNERGFNGNYITDGCWCSLSYTVSCNSPTGPCVCRSGFTGSYCETDINECLANPCPPHSTCINDYGSYRCICWNGTLSSSSGTCDDWNKILISKSGNIQSPGFPREYTTFINYTWTFRGTPNTVVSFRFSLFDVESYTKCGKDVVEVYDVQDDSLKLIGQYCGTNTPALIRSVDNVMLMKFKTDNGNWYRNYIGFNGTYYIHECPLFMYGEQSCTSYCSCAFDTTRVCDNTNGVCFCKPGWGGRGCSQDLDECRNPQACPVNSECVNTAGSFSCECNPGYTLNTTTGQCKESSQCSAAMKLKCSHLCDIDQTTKNESCYCPQDLVLQEDNATCAVALYPHGSEANDAVAFGTTSNSLPVSSNRILFDSLIPVGKGFQSVASVLYNGLFVLQNDDNIMNTPSLQGAETARLSLVAPFWTEKRKAGLGNVFYHVYEMCGATTFYEPDANFRTSPKQQEVVTRAIRDITKFYGLRDFEVSVVFVTTWIDVQTKGCYDNSRSTFQSIFISGHLPATDQTYLTVEEKSYVIFIYKDVCDRAQPLEVGIVSDSGVSLIRFDKSKPNLHQLIGNTGYQGMFKLEVGKKTSESLKCQRYLCKHADLLNNQHFKSEVAELYQCPCSLDRLGLQWQFLKDEGNTKCYSISDVAKRRLLQTNQRNRICCYSWTPPKSDSWEDWHASWIAGSFVPSGHILISDPWPWSLSFDNSNPYQDAEENMKAQKWCCANSPDKLCKRFNKIFGDTECTNNPIFVPASALGDPIIKTSDGRSYAMNAVGEFVLVEVVSSNFALQARTQKLEINGTLSNGTVFTAFAAQEDNDKFQVQLANTNTSMVLLANNMDYTTGFYADPSFTRSTLSMNVRRINENSRIIVAVEFSCGVSFKVHVGIKSLEIDMELDVSLRNKTRGLFGNFNGNPNDDFLLPNGTILQPNMTERQIYEQFAKKYLVTDQSSVFTYSKGESYEDFQDPDQNLFCFDEVEPSKLAKALEICGNESLACALDYIATGNTIFAINTKDRTTTIDQTKKRLSNNPPTITGPSNNYWLVYEGRENTVQVEVNDIDNDTVTIELFDNIPGVKLYQNGTITYRPDLMNPIRLYVRAKDSIGSYSSILIINIVVCPLCKNHGVCDMTATSADYFEGHYKIQKCSCLPAYTGAKCESEFNACKLSPCSLGQNCTDLTAAEQGNNSVGHKCGPCPAGTINVDDSCEDINECLSGTICDQECIDTYGSYKCTCRAGFRLDPRDGKTCNDINECAERTSGCEQICRNTAGNYTCDCGNGYTLSTDGRTCIIGSNISAICQHCQQVCTVTNGQVTCGCKLGYKVDETYASRCTDIDECNDKANPPCSQKCTNTVGKFQCSCNAGYQLDRDGVSCLECSSSKYGLNCSSTCNCHGQGTCDRVLGCVCDDGWSGTNCDKDVNECALPQTCPVGYICRNEQGSFTCDCPNGYRMENEDCSDIDECSEYTNACDLNVEDCYNNVGSYSCRCKEGFKRSHKTGLCEDVNECEEHSYSCEQICENGHGSYSCACYPGYRLSANRHNCEKYKDICNLNCSYGCTVDDKDHAFCICPRGYQRTGEGACEDINECVSAYENPCAHKDMCINTEGSYNCSCSPGYRLDNDGRSCVACSNGTWGVQCNNSCACGSEALSCDPILGCKCKPGCTGVYCTDVINRCLSGEITCQPNEECVISGCSSVCQCRKGFVWDNGQCQDVNECLKLGQHNCSQVCINTVGSYDCSCYQGYSYNSTTNTCEDIDECLDSRQHNCSQVCTNTEGSFVCSCNPGYRYNSTTNACQADVDECLQNPCPDNRKCKNLNGRYECVCWNDLQVSPDGTCNDCNRTLTAQTGYLTSPNYPEPYDSNSYCSWTIINSDPNAKIELSFIAYGVEGCPFDYVKIYSGINDQAPLLDYVCSDWQAPFISPRNNMHVVFTSDSSDSGEGFLAKYTAYQPCRSKTCSHSCGVVSSNPWTEKCQCPDWMKLDQSDDSKCVNLNACNATITEPAGYLISSNYPQIYPGNENCYWTIQGSQNSIVKLSFYDFDLEYSGDCESDFVSIYDGSSEAARLLGQFCGRDLPPTISSSGNLLYIRFKSNGFFNYKGFKGRYVIKEK